MLKQISLGVLYQEQHRNKPSGINGNRPTIVLNHARLFTPVCPFGHRDYLGWTYIFDPQWSLPIAQSIYAPAKSERVQLSRNRFDDNTVGWYKGAVSGLFSRLVSTVVALIRIRDFDTAGQLPLTLKFLSACLLCCWWSRGGYLLGRKIPRKPARGSLGFIEGALNLVGSLQAGERCRTSKNKRNQKRGEQYTTSKHMSKSLQASTTT